MRKSDLFVWHVPTPVKPSNFQPLYKRHAAYNIETNLGEIGSFDFDKRSISISKLLHCDLQTNLDVNSSGRLGSGRSGFFRRKYVKGVGRTALAANWNDTSDWLHNSGFMFASAALREFVVSILHDVLGVGDSIVQCEGFLLRKLNQSEQKHLRKLYKSRTEGLLLDKNFVGITVKDGHFCKLSNLVWWLQHFPVHTAIEEEKSLGFLFEQFGRIFEPAQAINVRSPADAATVMANAFHRGIENFMHAWKNGVSWGSIHNNFTADGRFMDLETPFIWPLTTIGMRCNSKDFNGSDTNADDVTNEYDYFECFEVLQYVRQIRHFIHYFNHQCHIWITEPAIRAPIKEFLEAFLEEMASELSHNHLLYSTDGLISYLVSVFNDVMDLSNTEKKEVEQYAYYAMLIEGLIQKETKIKPVELYRMKLSNIAPNEPSGAQYDLLVPKWVKNRGHQLIETNLMANNFLLAVDKMSDLEKIFQKTNTFSQKLKKLALS